MSECIESECIVLVSLLRWDDIIVEIICSSHMILQIKRLDYGYELILGQVVIAQGWKVHS
jgi:hypothetical protein